MAPTTSIIVTIIVIAILIFVIATTALYQLCARHRTKATRVQRNTEDTIRLTLGGPRSTEQVKYMKHVRERNLVMAWEEARRFAQRAKERGSRMLGKDGSVFDGHSTYIDDDDDDDDEEEADLGSVKSGAMVLGGRAPAHQYLAPPALPWMKHSPTSGSSVHSSDSAKSKAGSVVEEWESEHGGFSGYFGMKQPVEAAREERWV